MSRSRPSPLLGWCLVALVVATVSCASDSPGAKPGELSIELDLKGDANIDEVMYDVSGNGIDPITGVIDTSASGSTYSVEVFGLPQGKNYQVEMKATTVDKTTTCAGVATFDVARNTTTFVYMVLRCGPPEQLGGVRVNASINFCAEIITAVAAPLQTSVGNDIEVYVVADDWEGDSVEYRWAGTGGAIADPTARATTYTCTSVGNQSIAVRVSDDGFDYCRDEKIFAVRCVDGGEPECNTDEDCGALEMCVDEKCVPDLECTVDAQCAQGEICVQNECVPAPPECTNDADCIQGEICVNNECVPDVECTVDADCAQGEICVQNECVPDVECTVDADCAQGEICVNNACVPDVECTVDAQCAQGEICVQNECVPAPPECTSNSQCAQDEICVQGECVPAVECVNDLQCFPDGVCVNNECVPAPPECTNDTQCDPGWICVNNECEWGGANRCPLFVGSVIGPQVLSVGNLINVWSDVLDQDRDVPLEVRVTSNCGAVTDPLLVPNAATGESSTTVRCDSVTRCDVFLKVSDDGFIDCVGSNIAGTVKTQINCTP